MSLGHYVRACSHEPGTVNYPGVMIALGQGLPRVHMMIFCPGAMLPQVNFIAPGQVHCPGASSSSSDHYEFILIPLVFAQIVTENEFYTRLHISGAFWNFLLEKFIPNIDNEHAQDYSCPRATFAFCSHGEKLPRQGGLPCVVQRVTRLSKLPQGNKKLM